MQVATHTLYGRPLRNLADVDQAVKDAYDNTCGMPNCTRPLCMDLPSINVWAYRSFQVSLLKALPGRSVDRR